MEQTEKDPGSSSNKIDRKIVERNRRIHMNELYYRLASLLPPSSPSNRSKSTISQVDLLEQATNYTVHLTQSLEQLRRRKEELLQQERDISMLSEILVKEVQGSGIEVIVIIRSLGWQKWKYMNIFYQVISVVEEEGGEVNSSTLSTLDDTLFLTIHGQAKYIRVGIEISRLRARLRDLVS